MVSDFESGDNQEFDFEGKNIDDILHDRYFSSHDQFNNVDEAAQDYNWIEAAFGSDCHGGDIPEHLQRPFPERLKNAIDHYCKNHYPIKSKGVLEHLVMFIRAIFSEKYRKAEIARYNKEDVCLPQSFLLSQSDAFYEELENGPVSFEQIIDDLRQRDDYKHKDEQRKLDTLLDSYSIITDLKRKDLL